MSDQYNTPPKEDNYEGRKSPLSEEEYIEPPSFSLASLGLQRVGTAPPPRRAQRPLQLLNARGMPARIRKRNRLFYDDDIINDTMPLRMSLSPKKTPTKTFSYMKTPTKVLKKRRRLSSYMQSDEKNGSHLYEQATPSKSFNRSDSATTTPKSCNKSTPCSSPGGAASSISSQILPADKKIGHSIGMRLRNLLKLPKAHKWVIYEWFYSFVDKPLFKDDNDFEACLVDSYPKLVTRQLTRGEWRKIRSMMGKPRRCSPAFLAEERRTLERKRQKIRYMQTRNSGHIEDFNFVRDLPDKIPMALPIGTKVTARLRIPQDGIFSGCVDAFDSVNSTYRVTFDRTGLGTHSIPDYEILSESFHEMLPVASFTKDFRPNLKSIYNNCGTNSPQTGNVCNINLNRSDPLLGQEFIESPFKNPVLDRENINGYPIKLLEIMTRLKKALAIKRLKLQRLYDMNNEAELKISRAATREDASDESQAPENGCPFSEDFQRRYASIILTLEKMNRDVQEYLNQVQTFAGELTRDPQVLAMLEPSYLREKCREAADDAVERNNQGQLKSKSILQLIKDLATVLLVASHLTNDGNTLEVSKVMEGCIEEVKTSLLGINVETFQKHVQVHLHHIRVGIGQNPVAPIEEATESSSEEKTCTVAEDSML